MINFSLLFAVLSFQNSCCQLLDLLDPVCLIFLCVFCLYFSSDSAPLLSLPISFSSHVTCQLLLQVLEYSRWPKQTEFFALLRLTLVELTFFSFIIYVCVCERKLSLSLNCSFFIATVLGLAWLVS